MQSQTVLLLTAYDSNEAASQWETGIRAIFTSFFVIVRDAVFGLNGSQDLAAYKYFLRRHWAVPELREASFFQWRTV